MVLFQWGVYDFGQDGHFHYNITRQLIISEEFNKEDEIGIDEQIW